MHECYPKKAASPSSGIVLSTLVLGLVTTKSCFSFGIVSKNGDKYIITTWVEPTK